ncbi:MAG: beta-propeller domain-containing protein [bacterium]
MSAGLSRNGVLNIRGTDANDSFELGRPSANPNQLQVIQNGNVVFKTDLKRVKSIMAKALAGDDSLIVNEAGGKISVPVTFLGGRGDDVFKGGLGQNRFDGGAGLNVIYPSGGSDKSINARNADDVMKLGTETGLRQYLSKAARSRGRIVGLLAREPAVQNDTPASLPEAKTGVAAAPASGASGYSQTNTQVGGVDEGDIIENNGESLFILSRGELLIVDARNADAMAVSSRTKIDGWAMAEYLDGNRLTVISSVWNNEGQPGDGIIMPMLRIRTGGQQVQVTVFDVTNTASPTVISKTMIDGNYNDSRMVDGKLALIVQNDLLAGYWGGFGGGIAFARPAVGKMAAPAVSNTSLEKLVRKTPLEKLLPSFTTTGVNNGTKYAVSGLISQPDSIYFPVTGMEANLMSVVLVDTRAEAPAVVGATSIMGGYSSSIYMNSKDLYVFSPRWDDLSGGSRTGVQRFDISGTDPMLIATGSFDGYLLNQFSADASGEYLRVATTQWTENGSQNAVYVLTTQGDALETVGSLTGLAPGETIQSVRFMGDKAYLVTFKQVDPLFTIDLSTPTDPKVVGELKIPGFSRYLQPFGEGYILGIGRDADPATGRTTGLKVSLFDVRDDSSPKELASYKLTQPSNGWSWSDAEWDHHALGYFPEYGLIALPVQGYVQADPSYGPNGDWIPPKYQSDLVLLKIDTAGSITNIGTIEQDSSLLRSARIGDVIYSVADLDLKTVELLTDGVKPRGSLTLNEKQDDGGGPVIAL